MSNLYEKTKADPNYEGARIGTVDPLAVWAGKVKVLPKGVVDFMIADINDTLTRHGSKKLKRFDGTVKVNANGDAQASDVASCSSSSSSSSGGTNANAK